MPSITIVARVAVVCSVVLLVLIGVLSKQSAKGKLDWDWPFIAAYVLLFLALAAIYLMRGATALAAAMAVFVIATAAFDTFENLAAYGRDGYAIHVSIPKWLCYFVCVGLAAPLFFAARTGLGRVVAILLVLAAVAGIAASFTIDPPSGRSPDAVFGAAGLSILAFLLADVILLRDPRILLS